MALARVGLNAPVNRATKGAAKNTTLPKAVRNDRDYPSWERALDPDCLNSSWQTGLPCAYTVRDWRRYLSIEGFYFKTNDKYARLETLAKRCARGHQSYDRQCIKNLRELACNRGLDASLGPKANKKQLVEALEAADDATDAMETSREFHKFSELPPELRNRVYIFHFQSLGKVLPRFAMPPFCRASRQLRYETTILFFQHSTFIVYLTPGYGGGMLPRLNRAQLHYHTEVARCNVPNARFAQIKHLHIDLEGLVFSPHLATWSIDLTDGSCVRKTRLREPASYESHVQNLARSIMARKRFAKLSKSDLDRFEIAITNEVRRLRRRN
jgi:hypothetical protein